MKYIEIHKQTNRVDRVEDTLPSNPATAALFIECPDDNVAKNWWLDEATDTLHEEKIWTAEEIKDRRNELGGFLPLRRDKAEKLEIPSISIFDEILKGSNNRTDKSFSWIRILPPISLFNTKTHQYNNQR